MHCSISYAIFSSRKPFWAEFNPHKGLTSPGGDGRLMHLLMEHALGVNFALVATATQTGGKPTVIEM